MIDDFLDGRPLNHQRSCAWTLSPSSLTPSFQFPMLAAQVTRDCSPYGIRTDVITDEVWRGCRHVKQRQVPIQARRQRQCSGKHLPRGGGQIETSKNVHHPVLPCRDQEPQSAAAGLNVELLRVARHEA